MCMARAANGRGRYGEWGLRFWVGDDLGGGSAVGGGAGPRRGSLRGQGWHG